MANFKSLSVGQVLSESQYYTVKKISGDRVQLQNDHGEDIVVDAAYVNKCITSAHEVVENKTINKTEAATIFLANPSVAMTVSFQKQVKDADVVKEVMEGVSSASIKDIEKAVKAGIKKAIQGEERTMVGRHFGELNELGRVNFIDMEVVKDAAKGFDNRQRQVDPRTINYFILRGVKYTVK